MGWIYLNHVLSETTPLYGGMGKVRIEAARAMARGDSSNSSLLAMPAHAGTHIDAPKHFDDTGMALDEFPAEFWHARSPELIDVECRPGELLTLARLGTQLNEVSVSCDMILLRTGAETWRRSDSSTYTQRGPGIGEDVAEWLRVHRSVKMLGMDCVSVSSFADREAGRRTHRAFLGAGKGRPICLVEDMALAVLPRGRTAVKEIWVVPLLFSGADGAPATVLGRVGQAADDN